MITKEQCADYINANMTTALTDEEVITLRNSLNNFRMDSQGNANKDARKLLAGAMIDVFGDVTMLVEIRDAN
jgi:hypothetical protein